MKRLDTILPVESSTCTMLPGRELVVHRPNIRDDDDDSNVITSINTVDRSAQYEKQRKDRRFPIDSMMDSTA